MNMSPMLRTMLGGSRRGENTSRRRLLTILALVLLVATAGCTGALDDDDGEPGEAMEYVPEDTNMLIGFDFQMVAADEMNDFISGMNDIFMEEFGEPFFADDTDDLIDEFEAETGLDFAEAEHALIFGTMDDDPTVDDEVGIIFQSGWDHADVAEAVAMDEPYDLELTEYHGEDVLYVPTDESQFGEPTYIGVLPGDLIVIGDEDAVKAALDVAYDDAPSASGPMVDLHNSLTTGGITMAFDAEDVIDDDDIPDDPPQDQPLPPEVDPDLMEEIEAFGMAFYPGDGSFNFEMLAEATNEADAEDLGDAFDGMLSLWAGMIEDEMGDQELADEIRSIDVEVDGTTITASYSVIVDDLLDMVQDFIWFIMGEFQAPMAIGAAIAVPATADAPVA